MDELKGAVGKGQAFQDVAAYERLVGRMQGGGGAAHGHLLRGWWDHIQANDVRPWEHLSHLAGLDAGAYVQDTAGTAQWSSVVALEGIAQDEVLEVQAIAFFQVFGQQIGHPAHALAPAEQEGRRALTEVDPLGHLIASGAANQPNKLISRTSYGKRA